MKNDIGTCVREASADYLLSTQRFSTSRSRRQLGSIGIGRHDPIAVDLKTHLRQPRRVQYDNQSHTKKTLEKRPVLYIRRQSHRRRAAAGVIEDRIIQLQRTNSIQHVL